MFLSRVAAIGLSSLALWSQATCAEEAKLPPSPDPCSPERRLVDGGSFAVAKDGTRIWYKSSGRQGGPTIAYLHGGPGYNSYVFEKSAGKLLEKHYRLLYIDQRGCGRSGFEGQPDRYGMASTVSDIEHVRALVGASRLILAGHSFGGPVAAEYAHQFPSRVAAIIMIDTTTDMSRALAYQVSYINSIAPAAYPAKVSDVRAIAESDATPVEKLTQLYGLLGRLAIHKNLHYAVAANQARMEALDESVGFLNCTSSSVVRTFLREGYLTENQSTVSRRLESPTLHIAGRSSHVIGVDNIKRASETWGARTQWIAAGHFVYFERPDEFARAVERFLVEQGIRD